MDLYFSARYHISKGNRNRNHTHTYSSSKTRGNLNSERSIRPLEASNARNGQWTWRDEQDWYSGAGLIHAKGGRSASHGRTDLVHFRAEGRSPERSTIIRSGPSCCSHLRLDVGTISCPITAERVSRVWRFDFLKLIWKNVPSAVGLAEGRGPKREKSDSRLKSLLLFSFVFFFLLIFTLIKNRNSLLLFFSFGLPFFIL